MLVPLPKEVRDLLPQNTHPGLQLDKFAPSWEEGAAAGKLSERVQRPALEEVVRLSRSVPSGLDFASLRRRRSWLLGAAEVWTRRTAAPLTLHLSRPSALENAGLCLHRIYGFAYLPGTGLKGMARAYAERVWLPAQERQAASRGEIEAVFGMAPDRAGGVVFHDGWPEGWPALFFDIVNNHHAPYYQGGEAPGDWHNPMPVYFLAIEPGTRFSFALSKRRSDVPEQPLRQAKVWLNAALSFRGAGAKTATGYGYFRPEETGPAAPPNERRVEVRLVSPAFVGGAERHATNLRPASFRSQLRFWWRALRGGLHVHQLHEQEADVFGAIDTGNRLVVRPCPGDPPPACCVAERTWGLGAAPSATWGSAPSLMTGTPRQTGVRSTLWPPVRLSRSGCPIALPTSCKKY